MDRFIDKLLVMPNGCWNWTGYRMKNGYGTMGRGRRHEGKGLAHRIAHELFIGPIPEGLTIDHLCRNRGCVNPSHLEAVTMKVNNNRGGRAQHTHCPRGHPYSPENTYRRTDTGYRVCRICRAKGQVETKRRRQARKST